ncbi:hypothetical protein M378DRAFT_18760 [Amanita muscaria Koide BX008]|uniref:Uncharacterized protein n=1 Tax=Amanita muscaria (strain Koide BX008) TaxID=946122 RepID=A0A0C2WER9_AMAMK|nr:hypothetical protein M378DRAFT_18760 [Amanita muscaria Koide BX008]
MSKVQSMTNVSAGHKECDISHPTQYLSKDLTNMNRYGATFQLPHICGEKVNYLIW